MLLLLARGDNLSLQEMFKVKLVNESPLEEKQALPVAQASISVDIIDTLQFSTPSEVQERRAASKGTLHVLPFGEVTKKFHEVKLQCDAGLLTASTSLQCLKAIGQAKRKSSEIMNQVRYLV